MFLVIFASLDMGRHIATRGGIPYDDFFVPGILAYGIIASTFINMAISTAILRDEGVLKRMQGTPLPRWAYVAARIGSTFLIMMLAMRSSCSGSAPPLGAELPRRRAAGADSHAAARAAAFTAIGIGITRFIPGADSGPVVVNLVVLPLTFISNVCSRPIHYPRRSGRSPACSRSRRWPAGCNTVSIRATTALGSAVRASRRWPSGR